MSVPVLFVVGACSSGSQDSGRLVLEPETPTWHQDVAPLVAEHCQACHQEGQLAENLSFTDYPSAAPWARFMADEVEHGRMPPFYAQETDRCEPRFGWASDPRLSDEAIDLLRSWSEGGAPEGDPETASPLPSPEAFGLEAWDLELEVSFDPYEGDYQICFPVLNPLEAPRWIEAIEVVPGQPSLVHHVSVRVDPGGRSLERAEGEPWYPCTGTLDGEEIGGFLPGAPPSTYPEGAAYPLSPGDVLAIQIHYHVLPGVPRPQDRSAVRFKLTETAPSQEPVLMRVGNDIWLDPDGGILPGPDGETDFRIPAGAAHHRETFVKRFTLPGTWEVFLVANHMHYVGFDALLTIERTDPEASECLLHTPQWDLDWQQVYRIDGSTGAAPLLREGDRLRLECAYNNSMTNTRWMEQLALEGIADIPDVVLGDSAIDEMCSAQLGLIQVSEGSSAP